VPGGPNGTTLQDYCMLHTQQGWSLAYNTRNVKAEEMQNFKWDDLLTDKWKGRAAFDAQGLGFKELMLPNGWGLERGTAFANNLGANGLKLISGGSNGVVQAVIQGEGDIGWMSMDTAYTQMSRGAPLAFAWPEFAASNFLLTCTPAISANNPDLAMLFFAWRNFEGEWIQAELGGGGARPFYPPEADKYPLGQLIKDAGWTPEKNLIGPKNIADFDLIEPNRAAAIEAQKAGIQTGKKIPYPWGCQANHPSCVPG
jgi:spermidine/putrescine-binding protein